MAAIEHEPAIEARVRQILAERARVEAELADAGWKLPDHQGNFVWLATGESTEAVGLGLEQRGVVVRPFAGDGIRVTIGVAGRERPIPGHARRAGRPPGSPHPDDRRRRRRPVSTSSRRDRSPVTVVLFACVVVGAGRRSPTCSDEPSQAVLDVLRSTRRDVTDAARTEAWLVVFAIVTVGGAGGGRRSASWCIAGGVAGWASRRSPPRPAASRGGSRCGPRRCAWSPRGWCRRAWPRSVARRRLSNRAERPAPSIARRTGGRGDAMAVAGDGGRLRRRLPRADRGRALRRGAPPRPPQQAGDDVRASLGAAGGFAASVVLFDSKAVLPSIDGSSWRAIPLATAGAGAGGARRRGCSCSCACAGRSQHGGQARPAALAGDRRNERDRRAGGGDLPVRGGQRGRGLASRLGGGDDGDRHVVAGREGDRHQRRRRRRFAVRRDHAHDGDDGRGRAARRCWSPSGGASTSETRGGRRCWRRRSVWRSVCGHRWSRFS